MKTSDRRALALGGLALLVLAPGVYAFPLAPGATAPDTGVAVADTLRLPADWPEEFPSPPSGARVAGYGEVDRDEVPDVPGGGPYYIVSVILAGGVEAAFETYKEALEDHGWELLEAGTDDGSRGGLPTISFRGHGFVGDIRFDRPEPFNLALIHLYRDPAY